MKVWVTGARGFIGRHLSQYLAKQGGLVFGIGHGLWIEKEYKAWGVHSCLNGDITAANLDTLMQQYGAPDVIFHLAGGSSVGPSLVTPMEDFRRSVETASELLEWCRLHSPDSAVVMASSAAVYGAGHQGVIAETAASTPYSPYGFHKRMTELLLESYAHNFGMRVAVVRLFSVYGVELRKQLLWDACSRLSDGCKTLTLGGTGGELRDWLHVRDAVRILTLAWKQASSNGFVLNGGTGLPIAVKTIANKLCELWGIEEAPIFSGIARIGDPLSLVADTTKLEKFGFLPECRLEDGLAEYMAWFKLESSVT
jgi:UDP-glucose 4-epimerase